MKRIKLFVIALASSTVLITFFAFTLYSQRNKSGDTGVNDIPAGISSIFTKSCYDCHSDNSTSFAKTILNFSEWNGYSPKKQLKLGKNICSEMTDGNMPPPSYIEKNPAKSTTASQTDSVCAWTKTLTDSK